MSRPRKPRFVRTEPATSTLVPGDAAGEDQEPIMLGWDECEALRLVDYEGLFQEATAEVLGVSRQTVGRIVTSARRKLTSALVEGRALRIEGGDAEMMTHYYCVDCGNQWLVFEGAAPSRHCPACGGTNVAVAPAAMGPMRGGHRRGRKWASDGMPRKGRGRGRGGGRGREA